MKFPRLDDPLAELLRRARDRGDDRAASRRQSVRFQIDGYRAVLTVAHPGGSVAASEVFCVDISASGVGLLYPGFLHSGSESVLHIRSDDGEPLLLTADIVWCLHISGSVHHVGLRFHTPIDPRAFVSHQVWLEHMGRNDGPASSTLAGRVLGIGLDDLEAGLISAMLSRTDLVLTNAKSEGAAIDELHRGCFDIMIIDADQGEYKADTFRDRLRTEGFAEPALLVSRKAPSAEPEPDTAYLTKPLERDILLGVIRDLISSGTSPFTGSTPIRCAATDEFGDQAVAAYVERLRNCAETLRAAIKADNTDAATRVCQSVSDTASGYGLPLITAAAARAVTALASTGAISEAAPAVRLLIRMIGRVESPLAEVAGSAQDDGEPDADG